MHDAGVAAVSPSLRRPLWGWEGGGTRICASGGFSVGSRVSVEGDFTEAVAAASQLNKFPRALITVGFVEVVGYGVWKVIETGRFWSSDRWCLCGEGDSSSTLSV